MPLRAMRGVMFRERSHRRRWSQSYPLSPWSLAAVLSPWSLATVADEARAGS